MKDKRKIKILSKNRHLLKSAGAVGFITTVSRVLGYIRDATLAVVLGAGSSMDAFTIAYRVANLFRRFLGEGAMTTAFVPVFAEFKERYSEKELWKFVSKFFYSLALILVLLVAIQIIFANQIVGVMSPGFMKTPGKWELTVFLNRLMSPYIFCVGLAAVLMAVLNSVGSYSISASSPIFFNLAVIFSAFSLAKYFDEPAIGVSLGVVVGGIFQVLVQIPAAWRKGMRFVPSISFTHPAIRRITVLMGPGILGVGIYQINLLVDSMMSSFLPEGSVSAIYYSTRVVELVQGIFILSFATVILTEMSKHAARRNHREMGETLTFSLKMVSFVTIPASVGLILLAKPITQVLFEYGKFGAEDTNRTAFALFFYAVGIFFVAGARIVVQAFYAVQDTKTPVKCALISLVINIVGNVALMHSLKQGGIALATSIAAAVNFYQLISVYQKRFGLIDWPSFRDSLMRIAVQSLALGVVCSVFLKLFDYHAQIHWSGRVFGLFGTILISFFVYLGVAMILKSKELEAFLKTRTRKAEPQNTGIEEP